MSDEEKGFEKEKNESRFKQINDFSFFSIFPN